MTTTLNRDGLLRLLRARVDQAGSQTAAAEALGVSDAYLSDVLNGRRDPGEKILAALGLARDVRYVERDGE